MSQVSTSDQAAMDAVRDYSGLGWKVFPVWGTNASGKCLCGGLPSCKGGLNAGKHPMTPRGMLDATDDLDVLVDWWRENPHANIGLNCEASGLVVVDRDPRNGSDETWASLEATQESHVNLESSVAAFTGGGGRHDFFRPPKGEWRPPPRGALPGIDIKYNGYVVLPPSRHKSGGRYGWIEDGDPFSNDISELDLLPDCFFDTDRQSRPGQSRTYNRTWSELLPEEKLTRLALSNILDWAPVAYPEGSLQATGAWRITSDDLGRAYEEDLSIHPEGIRDHGPEQGFTPVDLLRRDFRLVDGELDRVEHDDWEEDGHALPGMTEEEAIYWLCDRLGEDWELMRQTAASRWFDNLGFETAEESGADATLRATPFHLVPPAEIPRRQWLYGTSLIRGFVSLVVAPGGTGKSALVASEALAMATGRTLLPPDNPRCGPLRVWVFNGEDPIDEMQRRFHAAIRHFDISTNQIDSRLFVDTGRSQPLVVAKQEREGLRIANPIVSSVEAELQNREIDVLIVDPFVSSHEVPENDNNAIDKVAKVWSGIAERANCAIMLVHHVRKGGLGHSEFTVDDARGASSLANASRSVRVLNRMTQSEAKKLRVGDDTWRYFRVDSGKGNLAPPGVATWRRLNSVGLGNGSTETQTDQDYVGVVAAWTPPDPLEALSEEDVQRVLAAISDGHWRENSQATDWVGKPIGAALYLDPSESDDLERIKAIFKRLKGDRMVRVESLEGSDRKRHPYVVVNAKVSAAAG